MSFVHLHTHSHYSLLDGLSRIPELIQSAQEYGMPAVALTDHGNLYGAIEFYRAAIEAGIKPIIGVEAYIAPNGLSSREPKERAEHLIILARNTEGYQNLIRLLTVANLEGFYYKPRIDLELLEQYSAGLIILSGCLSGSISRALIDDNKEKATALVERFQKIVGKEYFFLELQQHENLPLQEKVNTSLIELSAVTGAPLVATADSHYISRDDSEAHDVLLCIGTKKLLADENRMTLRDQNLSFASPEEMRERFAAYPEAVENTLRIADMVDIHIDLDTIQLPEYQLPAGTTADQYLREICTNGIKEKYDTFTPEMTERLEYELGVIEATGYATYFLIVQDFINWAKKNGIAVGPGRGSAAGSIVAYLTGITDIDPIEYELIFERFLNPERVSMPDIDTDFADIRRDDVLRYVEEKYGKDHVAQIITFGTIGARAGIRDVGRVLGLPYSYCDRISKMIPMFTSLDEAVSGVPELRTLLTQDPDAERLVSIAKKLEGVARHTSTHACAVVITKEPLNTMVPVQVDQQHGNIITQFSMGPIEKLGLLKMDFLGLKNLTIIEETLNIVRATTGQEINIEHIPLDDKKTFQLLQKANTIGVFQLESSGMRRYLKQLKPTEIEDIIAMVALYRPGPMELIPDYIGGKHGKIEATYLDERLRPILQKTYGIAVYQEQIMEIARKLAGFSYAEADVLRKAVGKKIKSLLDEQEAKMISGMIKTGIAPDIAKRIWEFILPFARYGFNRSHAACYAMIAYRTAYLKANFPAQFMAALLNADNDDSDRVAIEISHARDMDIEVLAPDINESFGAFSVVKEFLDTPTPRLRFGLHAIKNVGNTIVQHIIDERKQNGAFEDLDDLLTRVVHKDMNKKSLESLIKCGALDAFGERNMLLLNIEALLQFSKQAQEEERTGQSALFQGIATPKLSLQPYPPASEQVQLEWEKQLLGLYISGHPLESIKKVILHEAIPVGDLKDHPKKEPATVIGLVQSLKKVTTKKGDMMAFIQLADYSGEIECIVFPTVYLETIATWQEGRLVRCVGTLSAKDGTLKLLVDEATVLDFEELKLKNDQYAELPEPTTEEESTAPDQPTTAYVQVPQQLQRSRFDAFRLLLDKEPGVIHVILEVDGKQIDTKKTVSEQTLAEISEFFGQNAIRVV